MIGQTISHYRIVEKIGGLERLSNRWMSERYNRDEVAPMPDDEKLSTTMPGVVEKIIGPLSSNEPEKAQITVEGADHLYRELRIENTMKNADGDVVGLKKGAHVDVVVVADESDTVKKPE